MPAKFTLSKDKAGRFRFELLAANGAVVAKSATYATKASALNGLASVRKNAAGAALEDTTVGRPAVTRGATSARKAAAPQPATRKSEVRTPPARRAAAAKPVKPVKAAVKPAKAAVKPAKAAVKPAVKPAAKLAKPTAAKLARPTAAKPARPTPARRVPSRLALPPVVKPLTKEPVSGTSAGQKTVTESTTVTPVVQPPVVTA